MGYRCERKQRVKGKVRTAVAGRRGRWEPTSWKCKQWGDHRKDGGSVARVLYIVERYLINNSYLMVV